MFFSPEWVSKSKDGKGEWEWEREWEIEKFLHWTRTEPWCLNWAVNRTLTSVYSYTPNFTPVFNMWFINDIYSFPFNVLSHPCAGIQSNWWKQHFSWNLPELFKFNKLIQLSKKACWPWQERFAVFLFGMYLFNTVWPLIITFLILFVWL